MAATSEHPTLQPTSVSASSPKLASPAPPLELRHITSNTNLVANISASPSRERERRLSNRNSQHHLRPHRVGSRSPSSIPSSPTSVHSSSSAIFERDIEPIAPGPLTLSHSNDPHRIPRSRTTEQLEHSVPSVLDSAAAVLTSTDTDDDGLDAVSIITPAPPESRSGFTSPISRMSSRSPSPTGTGGRKSLLFSTGAGTGAGTSPVLGASPPQQGSPPMLIPRPGAQASTSPSTQMSPNSPLSAASPTTPATPTSAYFSASASAGPPSEAGSESSSPTTATHHEHPLHALPSSPQTTVTIPPVSVTSHPPSPKTSVGAPTKRLSFLSYMDLLSSTPAATQPLSSLTTGMVSEPPPHLPSVMGFPQAQAQYAASNGGSVQNIATLEREAAGVGILDDMGGEWEREGLGRGLEERLEALNAHANAHAAVSGKA
ncbi:uncharacterized protein LAESUDRAFT_765030 [Laetiporus sulphureus 93-53]|uniref:Uncharacterized protein n=1 Tax=Laetiporus sulphureus 93-53 TaxID=1314785 RepID=A0A165AZT0_9APHY|nr:uncharacterized protein LAESUDRAFT_765030 [Laetiporus sulphureus 93-53]KZS99961.1 hypothetical protein LAESUDRAFT_765030 [Laetiporus sulphureus 93-53]